MSHRFERKRRPLVVTSRELVEAATRVTEDAAAVQHILHTRASAAPGVARESGPAHHGAAPRGMRRDVVDALGGPDHPQRGRSLPTGSRSEEAAKQPLAPSQ